MDCGEREATTFLRMSAGNIVQYAGCAQCFGVWDIKKHFPATIRVEELTEEEFVIGEVMLEPEPFSLRAWANHLSFDTSALSSAVRGVQEELRIMALRQLRK